MEVGDTTAPPVLALPAGGARAYLIICYFSMLPLATTARLPVRSAQPNIPASQYVTLRLPPGTPLHLPLRLTPVSPRVYPAFNPRSAPQLTSSKVQR